MNAEDLSCDNRCDWELAEVSIYIYIYILRTGSSTYAIESIHKSLPNFNVASALALIVESIDTSDIRTFMVASKQKEVLGVLDLVAHE